MAVGSGVPYNSHTGNGVTRTFSYGFTVLSSDDLVATVDGTVTAVTVSGVGDANGGTVTFATAPASGAAVLLKRVLTYTRLVEYADNGDLLAETLNADLDRLLMLAQGLRADTQASLRVPIGETVAELPSAADRARGLLGFDAAGDPAIVESAEQLGYYAQWTIDKLSGNGSATTFSLSGSPGVVGNLDLTVDGLTLTPGDDYTLTGSTITFTTAPPAGTRNIVARYGQALPSGSVSVAADVTYTPAGGGAVERTAAEKLDERVSLIDFGADPTGATDATAAIVAAIAEAKSRGINAVDCSGGKWLVDTGDIDLENITLYAESPPDFADGDYADVGAAFLLTSTTTTPFVLGLGWALRGLTFYYPDQDGTAAPTVYPPLFTGTYIAGGVMEDCTVVNAYQFFKSEDGTAIGDLRFDRCRIFAIDRAFWFLQGAPETINITDCFFSYGIFPASYTPNTYLRDHVAASGEFMRIDVGASGWTSIDGLCIRGSLIFGSRYGVRVMSGTLNVSDISGNWFDQVATALSVEGSSVVANTRWNGNYHWSDTPGATTNDHPTIKLTTSGALSDLYINGNDFASGRGDHIQWNNLSADDVQIQGNRFRNWGLSTTGPATNYYAINLTDAGSNGSISGNTFRPTTGSVPHNCLGIGIGGTADMAVLGNEFESCYLPVWIIAATKVKVAGNVSRATGFSYSLRNDAGASVLEAVGNLWDKGVQGASGWPLVEAKAATQTFTGAKTAVAFGTESVDADLSFSTPTFTAPVDGDYTFEVALDNTTGMTVADTWALTIERAGSASDVVASSVYVPADVAGAAPLRCRATFRLAAADTVTAYVTRLAGAGNYVSVNDATYNRFSARRLA